MLYHCFQDSISCAHDAVVCFVHWELITAGYRCLGSGDEAQSSDKKSELLPADWSVVKEPYTLRYKPTDGDTLFTLKGIPIDASILFNFMNMSNQKIMDLVVNVSDHVDADKLQTFDSAYKDVSRFSETVRTQLLPPRDAAPSSSERRSPTEMQRDRDRRSADNDPLYIPHRPNVSRHWPTSLDPPFAAGGADLDPFGSRGGGGMIVDPLRSGYPRSGLDPSSGFPDILPPGAVPPRARFDPIGPIPRHRPEPDPDHLPPPGYDDMFM